LILLGFPTSQNRLQERETPMIYVPPMAAADLTGVQQRQCFDA
jgi:hypothetical protein